MTRTCPHCAASVPLVTRELLFDPGNPFHVLARHTREESSTVSDGDRFMRVTRQVRCPGSFEEVSEALHGAA